MTETYVRVRYPLDFSMQHEDSQIPIVGYAQQNVKGELVLARAGMVVLLDTRWKKILYRIQGELEVLELVGTLSLKSGNGANKYAVLHVANSKLIEYFFRQAEKVTSW